MGLPALMISAFNPERFNPYQRERLALWRNRIAHWRAEPGESVFLALGLAVFAVLAGAGLWQSAPHLIGALQLLITRWPASTALLALLGLAQIQAMAVQTQRAHWARHWLVAQPIDDALRRRILLRQVLLRAGAQTTILVTALYVAGAGPRAMWVGAAIAVIAALLGWLLAMRGARAIATLPRRQAVLAVRGRGSFWSWQWTEAAASLAPYRMARSALLILLVPMGDWTLIWLALSLMALAIAGVAWVRCLAVLPAAQSWLAVEALPAKHLLLACIGCPLLLLIAMLGALAFLLSLMGAAASLWILVVIALLAPLHWACTAAERRHPARIGLQLGLHLALLFAVVQAMPVLALPCWLMQMLVLLRRGLH